MKLEKEQLVKLYSIMIRSRKIELFMIDAYKKGTNSGWYHAGPGEEAIPVGKFTFNVTDDDYLWPHHRGHMIGSILARDISPKAWFAGHYGKIPIHHDGPSNTNKGISMYGGTRGGQFPVTLGWGVAAKKNNRNQVVICFFGDGASGRGPLHEAMNLASLWKLPIVYICQNNQMSMFVPAGDSFAREDIADIAYGFNMPGIVVDGQDVLAVHEAVGAAIERARKRGWPILD